MNIEKFISSSVEVPLGDCEIKTFLSHLTASKGIEYWKLFTGSATAILEKCFKIGTIEENDPIVLLIVKTDGSAYYQKYLNVLKGDMTIGAYDDKTIFLLRKLNVKA